MALLIKFFVAVDLLSLNGMIFFSHNQVWMVYCMFSGIVSYDVGKCIDIRLSRSETRAIHY